MPKSDVLVVSDLHVGSIYGLMPPGFETSDGRDIGQNVGQKHLWNCWLDLCERMKKLRVSALVINGDAVDGKQQAQRGTELNLPIISDQAEAAALALKPLMDATKCPIYCVAGTEYHAGKAAQEEERLAAVIGATRYAGLGTGRYLKEVLDLEIDGVVINFSHGIGVAQGLYRATPPDREGVWSALSGKDGKAPKADCVVRSHAHYFIHVEHESKHIIITPCWQLQTRYMRKNSPYRMVPTIGASIVSVDPQAKREGHDPIDIHKVLYPLPPIKTTKLVI